MCSTASPTMRRPACSISPASAGARSSSGASATSNRALEQRRRAADRQRPAHPPTVDEAQRHGDRGLALERRAFSDRIEADQDARPGILARDAAEPGQELVELVDGGADASLRENLFEVELLEHVLEPD